MSQFKLVSPFQPMGDQVQAIQELVDGLKAGKKEQVLLGGTGTGKTSSGAIYTRVLSVFDKNSCRYSNSCCFTLIMLIFVRK